MVGNFSIGKKKFESLFVSYLIDFDTYDCCIPSAMGG